MINFGIDQFLSTPALRKPLSGRRIALLAHPASITATGQHSVDALMELPDLEVTALFGPQHGMRGDKQDNMVETMDEIDPRHGIPVFSLYGEVRAPTARMLESFDVLLVDLQDVGTRIYTYVTTLAYLVEACSKAGKGLWILDRPNPAGRPVEGSILDPGWESFVGAGPLIMRHGMTMGELAEWFRHQGKCDLDLRVIPMTGYSPEEGPGFGWPILERPWINPSPNASSLNMARCYPGTVLLEGTTLSEGRGTTVPLEIIGAPDLDFARIIRRSHSFCSSWMDGIYLRPCWFEPTFHKHAGKRCGGLQLHTDFADFQPHRSRPYRLLALLLKAIRLEYPDYPLWRQFAYEYETERLAIDLIAGGPFLREWIDDPGSLPEDLEQRLCQDETQWKETTRPFLLYD